MINYLKRIELWKVLACLPLLVGLARVIHFIYTGYMVPDEAYYYSSIFVWFKSGKLLFPYGRYFFQFILFGLARILNLNTVEKFYTIAPIFLSVISCFNIYIGVKIVEKKDPDFKETWVVPLLFVLSPTYLVLTPLILTEITAIFIMMITLYVFLHAEESGKLIHVALTGLLVGLVCDWREFLFVVPLGISLRYMLKKKYRHFLVFILLTFLFGSQTYGRGLIVFSKALASSSSNLSDINTNITSNENLNIAINKTTKAIAKGIEKLSDGVNGLGKTIREFDIIEKAVDPLRDINANYTVLEWNFGVLPPDIIGRTTLTQFIYSVVTNFFFVLIFSLGTFTSIPLIHALIKKKKYDFWIIMGLLVVLVSIVYVSTHGTYSNFIFGKISTIVRYGVMGIFVIPFVALYTKNWSKKQLKTFFAIAIISTSIMIVPFTKISQSNLGGDINRVFQPGYRAPWRILNDYLKEQNSSDNIIVICDPIIIVKLYSLENVQYVHIPATEEDMAELMPRGDVIYVYGEKYVFYDVMHETQVNWYYIFLRNSTNYNVIFEDSQMYLYEVIQ